MQMIKEQKEDSGFVSPTFGKHTVASSTVFNEDCVAGMKRYPDKHFDLAVVDPPYELKGWHDKGNNRVRFSASEGSKRKKWDIQPTDEYFKELSRVSKEQIIWGGNYFLDYLGRCVAPIIWDKNNGTTHFADGEMAWTSFETGTLRIIKLHLSSTEVNSQRMHPTQKPIKLYDWIFNKYGKDVRTILDTNLGSQSSRIAADKAGLDFTGFEIDKEYFDDGNKRFEQYKSQLRIEGW